MQPQRVCAVTLRWLISVSLAEGTSTLGDRDAVVGLRASAARADGAVPD